MIMIDLARELEDWKVDPYCRAIIQDGYESKSDFDAIQAEAKLPFLLGTVGIFKLGELRRSANKGYYNPYYHVGRYRLGRYLDMADSKPNVNDRGFFSWRIVASNRIEIDPEMDAGRDDDIVCLAYDKQGHILGHLGISWLPEEMDDEPMNPDERSNIAPVELEIIYGQDVFRQDERLMQLRMGQVAMLHRFSSVPNLPKTEEFVGVSDLVKAKIATHLVTSAFLYINSIRKVRDLQMLMFDGERAARRGVELLSGIQMRQFDNAEYQNIPPILGPRYLVNNKEPIKPYSIDLRQLDDPAIEKLERKILEGDIGTYALMVFKDTLNRLSARRNNKVR